MRRGTSFGAPTVAESELAELIIEAVPVDREGPAGQLRHRGHDERHPPGPRITPAGDVIVKFAGNYHGHVDSLLVAAGSSAATLGVPNSPGVTAGTARDTLVLRYNDAAGVEAAFARARRADRRA